MTLETMIQQLGSGMVVSTEIFFLTLLFSLPLGLLVCFGRMSRFSLFRWLMSAYISVMRGPPLMLQLMVVYFGPYFFFGISITRGYSMVAVLIGFALNYAAYFAEIFRGGLLSIDRGQYEACQVLGLNKVQTTFHVILPQMIRVALPSITNESITLVKDTALVFAISITEILYYAKAAVTRTGNVLPYVIAFVIYLAMNTVLQLFFNWLEKKMAY